MAQAGNAESVTILTAETAHGYDIPVQQPAGLAVLAAGATGPGRRISGCVAWPGGEGSLANSSSTCPMEDHLLRELQSRLWSALPERIRQRADGIPHNSIQEHVMDGIQRKAGQADAQRRREVEEVENTQRVQVYALIDTLVRDSDLTAFIGTLIDEVAAMYVRRYTDCDRLLSALAMLYPTRLTMNDLLTEAGDPDPGREERISADAHTAYERHEQFLGSAAMRQTEQKITYSVLTRNWSHHLAELAAMRAAVGLDSGSRDGLAEYQDEAMKRYSAMMEQVKEYITGTCSTASQIRNSAPPACSGRRWSMSHA